MPAKGLSSSHHVISLLKLPEIVAVKHGKQFSVMIRRYTAHCCCTASLSLKAAA
jgi:hypothetical protein